MPFAVTSSCRCCTTAIQRKTIWHCENCWNKFHNGEKDKDWLNEDKYKKTHIDETELFEQFDKLERERLV